MLKHLTDSELLSKLRSLVSEERRVIAEVLDYLREVDARRLYADFGHSSLWDFCIQELGYSEGCAMRRIASMRLIRDLPEVRADLVEGRQTISSLAQAQKFFRQEEIEDLEQKKEVLKRLEGKSSRECERELSFDQPKKIKISIPKELLEKLQKLQASNESLTDLIERMANEKLKKLEAPVSPPTSAVTLTPKTRRFIWQRDQGKCTQCGSEKYLEIDHILPRALGGTNKPENLRLLCRAHNQRASVRAFGPTKL
jgi:hypothetical protein